VDISPQGLFFALTSIQIASGCAAAGYNTRDQAHNWWCEEEAKNLEHGASGACVGPLVWCPVLDIFSSFNVAPPLSVIRSGSIKYTLMCQKQALEEWKAEAGTKRSKLLSVGAL